MQDNELLAAFRHYQNLASSLAALYQMKLIGYDEHQRQLGGIGQGVSQEANGDI